MSDGSVSRSSPPTQRVVAILDFLAKHPQDRFGLSELARRLDLAKPTCLGIVTTLTQSGYLVRDAADKTYRLGAQPDHPGSSGPGVPAGQSGCPRRTHPAVEDLRYHRGAGRSRRRPDHAAGIGWSTRLRRRGYGWGQSYPFAPPPVGLMFVLWDDEALRGWLGRTPTIPLRTATERLDRVIAECRTAGYLVEQLTPPGGRRLYALMAGMSATMPDELRALLGELISDIGERVYLRSESEGGPGSRQRHDVSVISAPVYDHHHRQAMVVSLQIGRALTDSEIVKHAKGLVATADALTAQLGGTKPQW